MLQGTLQLRPNPARFVPGFILRGSDDRSEGDIEARLAVILRRFGQDPVHHRTYCRTRFTEERIDIAMLGADAYRSLRDATKIHWDVRLLARPHLGEGFFDVVEVSLEVERFLRHPDSSHNFQIFICPRVALVMP